MPLSCVFRTAKEETQVASVLLSVIYVWIFCIVAFTRLSNPILALPVLESVLVKRICCCRNAKPHGPFLRVKLGIRMVHIGSCKVVIAEILTNCCRSTDCSWWRRGLSSVVMYGASTGVCCFESNNHNTRTSIAFLGYSRRSCIRTSAPTPSSPGTTIPACACIII